MTNYLNFIWFQIIKYEITNSLIIWIKLINWKKNQITISNAYLLNCTIYKIKNKYKECANLFFLIATQFVTNVQLKDLTHMFCSWISSHKLCKQGVFIVCSH
jgi:hypothetical protein